MKLTDAQVDTYRLDGVLPLGQVLDESTVATAREHVEELRRRNLTDNPSEDPDRVSIRLLNVSSHDDWFMTIVTNENVLDAAESVLGPNIQYYQDNMFYKPAKEGACTFWHQDNIWWHGDPPNLLTIWIALDDVDASNGAVQYIRGSNDGLVDPELEVHDPKAGTYKVLAPSQVDASLAVSFTVPAGHAVMHHCLTIHGAPPNDSDRPRRGYTVHLQEAGLKEMDPEHAPVLRGRLPAH